MQRLFYGNVEHPTGIVALHVQENLLFLDEFTNVPFAVSMVSNLPLTPILNWPTSSPEVDSIVHVL
jgi:hypothetical protein